MSTPGLVIADGLSGTVTDGPLVAAAGIALLVGVIGFLSPCVLPLVPGYLAYVAGLNGVDDKPSVRRSVSGAVLFVLGFTAVFVALGVAFGTVGSALREHQLGLERILGVVVLVFGLAFLGWLPLLQRQARMHARPAAGLVGAPLLGLTFGLAWTPCLTPTLLAVVTLASQQGTAGRGAFLSFVYCLGLGVPFVLVAFGLSWVSGALTFLRRYIGAISRAGGALLVLFGVLLVSGVWDHWMHLLQAWAGPGAGVQV